MNSSHSLILKRLLVRLWPDAEARRYLPIIFLLLAPLIYLSASGVDYAITCHHFPDIYHDGRGNIEYQCLNPAWIVKCSETVRSETTDVCLRRFSRGITFINHFKSNLELECKSTKGRSAYINGSQGCVCHFREDSNGRCVDPETYCQSHYEAEAGIVTNPSGTIETFVAEEEEGIYGVCRCPDDRQFDVETSRCR